MMIYLLISFIIPWTIWILMGTQGLFGSLIYTIISALIMWLPAASACAVHLIRKTPAISFSLRPLIRKNVRYYLAAWFMPVVLSLIGCAVYFIIFRKDFSFSAIERTSMTAVQFLLLTTAAVITAAPFNMLFALGEEIGWRGFLYPELSARFGKGKACMMTGIIWGLWHTPVNMMGYNYGLGYPGYPLTGIAAMCISCIALGAWCSYLAERTGSIWAPALFHGAVNAAGGLGLVFMKPGLPYLLGPGITGIIPSVITGLFLLPFISRKKGEQND